VAYRAVGGGLCVGESAAGVICGAVGTAAEPIGMMSIEGRRLVAVVAVEATSVRVEMPASRALSPRLLRPEGLGSALIAVVLPKRPAALTVVAMRGEEVLGRDTFDLE
jgi:hypothetical protein